MNPEPNTQWRRETKYLVVVGLVIFALYVLYLMRPVLSLLILASLIAMVVNPIIRFFYQRLKIPRGAAVMITYLMASLLILIIPLILLPQIVNAVNFLAHLDYAGFINTLRVLMENTLIQLRNNNIRILGVTVVMDQIVDPVLGAIQNVGPAVPLSPSSLSTLFPSLGRALTTSLGLILGIAGSFAANIALFFLMILASIFISQDAYKLWEIVVNSLPLAYQPEIESLFSRLSNTWNSYLKGQLLIMISVGMLVWLGAAILGLPWAFALGILAGILELLPNIGPLLAIIPAILVALTQGSTHVLVSNWVFTLIVIAFYLAVQQIENFLIVPKLMSRAVKLHPLVLILGVLIGTLSFGLLGAFLATPVIASVKEIVKYLYLKIRDLPAEVDIPIEPSSDSPIRLPRPAAPSKQEETAGNEEPLAEEGPLEQTDLGSNFHLAEMKR